MKEEDALELGQKAKKLDIELSVHGPYYVVLTSEKEHVIDNSKKELLKTTHLADIMGAKRVVLHPGFYAGRKKEEVLKQFIRNIKIVEKDKETSVKIHPETMGKHSQFGDLDEVITICENTESEPCIDFGHLHARRLGKLKVKSEFQEILEEIEKRLGSNVLRTLHCHFYPVEFTDKGEKKHRAVTEKNVFPRFEPFADLIKEFKIFPTLISEVKR